ncbi:MAG: efflux RND transporter periplasmic adaptor subunit [Verrucomicrobia bacterium]|nr:efflux RND transporter periplasmic adaptor subunit [Verrucomicrobiota bacterium]
MKSMIIFALIIALGLGGCFLWTRPSVNTDDLVSVQRVMTAEVQTRDIRFEITVAGEIGPAEQVSVLPEINGRIASLHVDIGDKVTKGAVLFTLDDKELQNQRSSTLTEIDRALLVLEKAERNFKRNQKLFEEELISTETFENIRIDFDLAGNALERSNKDLLIIEEKLSKTQIKAPFDCTVLLRPVSLGQAVSGSGGVGGGTEVLAVADLNQMVIIAHVNQVDVVRLKLEQSVSVKVEAITGLNVNGMVERIAPQAIVRNGIKGFSVRIQLSDMDERIQPGMTANVTIPVRFAEGVTAVPLASVFTDRDDHHVYVQTPTGSERRSVEIGLTDYQHVEILSGVAAGEVVWLEEPPDNKEDGASSGD